MMNSYRDNGYLRTIREGIETVRGFRSGVIENRENKESEIRKLKKVIDEAEAIIIGAGSGLSTSAGFTYSGKRLDHYFWDFRDKYGITDMYSGGFYPYPSKEEFWAYWSRYIYINRYMNIPNGVYEELLQLVRGKDYFVITTNVDHCFQKAGFDKNRLFYTQGDYGLFQSTNRKNRKNYDNEQWVRKAVEAQGFILNKEGFYDVPEDGKLSMTVPAELIPICPDDGYEFTMNLRSDDSFLEDQGWHEASKRYSDFLRKHEKGAVLYFELGVGMNTPVIIKYPFWAMTSRNLEATYACLNYSEAYCPKQIENQSIIINDDINSVLQSLRSENNA